MTTGKKINIFVIASSALCSIPLSFADPAFYDGEKYLLVKTLIGGVIFSFLFSLIMNADNKKKITISFKTNVFDFTKLHNTFFIIGIAFVLSGITAILICALRSTPLIVPGYVFTYGVSLICGSLLFRMIMNKFTGRS